jgi:hypothetical protein
MPSLAEMGVTRSSPAAPWYFPDPPVIGAA